MKKVQHEKVKYEKLSKVRHCSAQTDNGPPVDGQLYIDKITAYDSAGSVHENDKIRSKISKYFLDVIIMIWKSD